MRGTGERRGQSLLFPRRERKAIKDNEAREQHKFFLSIDLRDRNCLVVGGGAVARRKAVTLRNAGAAVTVVSPGPETVLQKLAREKAIRYICAEYSPDYLQDVFLAVAATGESMVNQKVAAHCHELRIPVNVADDPVRCTFFFPSLVDRGPLQIAISTSGRSPAFARLMREELEERYAPEIAAFLEYLGRLRPRILQEVSAGKKRKELFRLLAGPHFYNLYLTLPAREMEEQVAKAIHEYADT